MLRVDFAVNAVRLNELNIVRKKPFVWQSGKSLPTRSGYGINAVREYEQVRLFACLMPVIRH